MRDIRIKRVKYIGILKRMSMFVVTVVLFLSSTLTLFACEEEQTNIYVSKVLFGDNAYSYESNEKLEQLESALYLCSEQSNRTGQEKLSALKKAKVKSIPMPSPSSSIEYASI